MKKLCFALFGSLLLAGGMVGCGDALLDPIEQQGPTSDALPGKPSAPNPPADAVPDGQEADVAEPYQGNTCQCLAGVSIDYSVPGGAGNNCTACIRNQAQDNPQGPCVQEHLDCWYEPGCIDIWTLGLSEHQYDPDLIPSIILPFDKDESHKKFQAIAECVCARCTEACVYRDPIECVAP